MKLAIFTLMGAFLCHAQSDQKGSLRGKFVDDLFQQGVAKARVTLTGNGNPLTADSDVSGNFSLTALTPGNYSMAVEKAGFLRTDPRAIAIEAAGALNLGDITLVQSRRIRGKVRWPDGEPVNTASVQIMQLQAGKPVQGIGGYRTNDRGEYSMNEVRPGRYVVFASYSGWYNQTNSSLSPKHALPVFYPAAPTPESASIVDVRTRAEAVDIDIVLQDRPGVVVEGIVEPTAKFPAGSEANLILIPDGIPSEFIASARMKAGETFKFPGIPEGRYLLVNNSRELFRRAQPLTVGRGDVRDVRIPMPDAEPVGVKFEMEEALNGQTNRTPLKVEGNAMAPSIATRGRAFALGPYGMTTSRLDKEGRLAHTDVADGAIYTLEFPRLPADSYVASVTQGGRTQTSSPFQFSTGAGAVTVALRKDGGTVGGTAFTDSGSATAAFVVLAPKDRKNALRFKTATTAKDGSFAISGVAPGEYDVFAFSRNDEDWYLDEDYLRRYATRAAAIEVKANGSAAAQPKVIAVAP